MATSSRPTKTLASSRLYISTIDITLKKSSQHPIYAGIAVDGERVHKLPPIAPDLPLRWSDNLPIDVTAQSEVVLHIKENHIVRFWQEDLGSCALSNHVDWLSYQSDGAQKEIVLDTERFTVHVTFSPPLGIGGAQILADKAIDATQDPKNSILGRLGDARSAIETIMSVVEHVEDVHPIAKAALGTLTNAFKYLEEEERYDELLRDLALGMANMLSFAETVEQHTRIIQLKDTIAQMMRMVEDASRFILKDQSKNKLGRFALGLVSSKRRSKVHGFIDQFNTLRKTFDRGIAVQVSQTVVTIEERLLLDKLPTANSADYDPGRCCMEGTRAQILQDVIDWTLKPNGSTAFLWIHGLAGAGKTCIASSIASDLEERKCLGASFFCSRDKPELRDPALVLPTIATRLGVVLPSFGKVVADQLRQDPHIGAKAIPFQYEGLFSLPVKRIAESGVAVRITPLVIVIDALDECGSTETRKILLKCLLEISRLCNWLKVVATSRAEPDIVHTLKASSLCTSFPLSLDDHATFDDILLFTQARMAEIVQTDGIQPSDWPGMDRTKELAMRAGGLFIWAQTASLFISSGQDSEKRLQLLLSTRSSPGTYAKLDSLYTAALIGAFGEADDDDLETFRLVVGTIVTVLNPLPAQSLYDLLQRRIPLVVIRKVIRSLGSVLYEDDQNELVVRACHLSFIDFITDDSRCRPQFFINTHQHHTSLVIACLRIMQDGLRFNICDLESSDVFNDQVPNLPARVKAAIPVSLRYSCVHWMPHVCLASKDGPSIATLLETIDHFLGQTSVLFWIEALSLLGEISAAIHGLPLVVRWFQDRENPSSLFIADIHRFILAFKEPIIRSTPHLYTSALPLAPTESLVSKRFLSSFPNIISIDHQESSWSLCLQTLGGHGSIVYSVDWSADGQRIVSGSFDKAICVWDSTTGSMLLRINATSEVYSVTFSPNGGVVASGLRDGSIQVWDVETGVPILSAFSGHADTVHGVIYSPDGKNLASCSYDRTICIWDALTGGLVVGPLTGHSGSIYSISYSPDGARIVSGSDDKTIRVWDARTGRIVLGPLNASGEVQTVDFSPDGQHILSGSRNGSAFVWDSITGVTVLGPLHVVGAAICSVKFSPDGLFILSASHDTKTRIWHAENGLELSNHSHLGPVASVCFSPDGQHFVTGCDDRMVRIWELNFNQPAPSSVPVSCHTDYVYSVALSPNGKYIVSGSRDKTVRVWYADSGILVCPPLRGHTKAISAVTFSPDGRYILSASYDKTLRMWAVATWESTSEPFSGHTNAIVCATFFPDGQCVASGSFDRTIRLWDPDTGKEVCRPLLGHDTAVTALNISRDGRLIASGSKDASVKIWDSENHAILSNLSVPNGGVIWSLAFSPDGRYIAFSSDDSFVQLWAVQMQEMVWGAFISGTIDPTACIFSLNGKEIICSSASVIFVLDATTGSIIRMPFKGHVGQVISLAILPDGKRLISGSSDTTIRAWDIDFGDAVVRHQELSSQTQRLLSPVRDDGWIQQHSPGDPLLWIPREYRDGLWQRLVYTIPPTAPNHPLTLDCSRFRHGVAWTEMRDP